MLCPLPPNPRILIEKAELISALFDRWKLKPMQKELCPSIHLRWGKGGWFTAKEVAFGGHSFRKCPSLSISLRFAQFMSWFEELKRNRKPTWPVLRSLLLGAELLHNVSAPRGGVLETGEPYYTLRDAKWKQEIIYPSCQFNYNPQVCAHCA